MHEDVRVYCCNAACQWSGVVSQLVHPKHKPTYWLCPECGEVGVERERMDEIVHAAPGALLQRFRELRTQFRQNHAAWHEAIRVGDFPLQSALIACERALLTEAREEMAAFQAMIAQRRSSSCSEM